MGAQVLLTLELAIQGMPVLQRIDICYRHPDFRFLFHLKIKIAATAAPNRPDTMNAMTSFWLDCRVRQLGSRLLPTGMLSGRLNLGQTCGELLGARKSITVGS